MGDFADYLGQYLDSTVVQLAKISQACENFADKCVLNGYIPPHPNDLQRVLKDMNLVFSQTDLGVPQTLNNDTNNNIIINANPEIENQQGNSENKEPQNSIEPAKLTENDDNLNSILDSLKNISAEDLESIKALAKQQKNILSQFTINKIHSKVPNVATKDIRNYLRVLISQGEIAGE